MKKNKIKISAGAFIAILIIVAHREYEAYKLKQEQKQGKIIEFHIEDIDFDDFFIPVDEENSKKGGK